MNSLLSRSIISIIMIVLIGRQEVAYGQWEAAQVTASGFRAKLNSDSQVELGDGDPNLVCNEMRNERICSACCNNNHYETFVFNANQCYCVQNDLESHKMAENQTMDLKKLLAMSGLKT